MDPFAASAPHDFNERLGDRGKPQLPPAAGFLALPISVALVESEAERAFLKFCRGAGMRPVQAPLVMNRKVLDTFAPRRDLIEARLSNDSLTDSSNEYEGLVLPPETTLDLLVRVASETETLTFPLHTSQLSRVYRAEALSENDPGRSRGFAQANIDIIRDKPVSFTQQCAEDVELVIRIHDALNAILEKIDKRSERIESPRTLFRISNRLLIEGISLTFGFHEHKDIQAIVVALDTVPRKTTYTEFESQLKLILGDKMQIGNLCISVKMASMLWELRKIEGNSKKIGLQLAKLDRTLSEISNGEGQKVFNNGVNELLNVLARLETLSNYCGIKVKGDAGLARSCPIYRGLEFEVTWLGHEGLGSIAGGGRCDDVATQVAGGKTLTLVGGALGLTRIAKAIVDSKASQRITTADVILTTKRSVNDSDGFYFEKFRNISQEWKERDINVRTESYGLLPFRELVELAKKEGISFIYFIDVEELYDVEDNTIKKCSPQSFRLIES